MMHPPPNPSAASVSDPAARVAELQGAIDLLQTERRHLTQRVKDYMAAEDPVAGVFHNQEIFAATQRRNMLEVEILALQQKIRRLQLGYDEDAQPHVGGLL